MFGLDLGLAIAASGLISMGWVVGHFGTSRRRRDQNKGA
jgi:hypothetical protein